MDRTELLQGFEDAKEQYRIARRQAANKLDQFLMNVFITLSTKDPKIKRIEWNQYTPYFNDGDSCEFQCHIEYPTFYSDENEDKDESSFEPDNAIGKEWRKLVGNIDEDIFLQAYGDHMTVVITKTGVSTKDCQHD